MDNFGIPGVQPRPQVTQTATEPARPMVQQVQVMPEQKKDISGLIKTIVIVVVSLIAVTFIGLFIWMMSQYNEAKSGVDSKIAMAVAEAKDEQAMELEKEFAEREKYPYRTFSGPADYGQLTFEYPKTWSVYIEKSASNGGDFVAYLNPLEVEAASKETINALRVTIRDKSFDAVTEEYQKYIDRKESELSIVSTTIGKDNNIVANRYTGTIPNTELNGFIVIFKIRDKTVILQTDSVLFEEDYNKLLGTITFNE